MIISRIAPLALRSPGAWKAVVAAAPRSLSLQQQQQFRLISTTLARQSGGGQWYYRSLPPADKKWVIWAEVAGAFMWWWIFWHIFTDYHHIIGHGDFPDIDAWTDEQLGIPSDDQDDPEETDVHI